MSVLGNVLIFVFQIEFASYSGDKLMYIYFTLRAVLIHVYQTLFYFMHIYILQYILPYILRSFRIFMNTAHR